MATEDKIEDRDISFLPQRWTEQLPAELKAQLVTQQVTAKIFMDSGLATSVKSMAQAIVFMNAGRRAGLDEWESLDSFDVIEGRLAMRAKARATCVKRSGKYNYRKVEHTDKVCRLMWYEDGVELGESSFTMDDAARARLVGKQNWQMYPSDMLFNRALSRGQRQFCPEVTGGARLEDPDEAADAIGDTQPQPTDALKAKVAEKLGVAPNPPPPAAETVIDAQYEEEREPAPEPPKRGPGRPRKNPPQGFPPEGQDVPTAEPSSSTAAATPTEPVEVAPDAPTEAGSPLSGEEVVARLEKGGGMSGSYPVGTQKSPEPEVDPFEDEEVIAEVVEEAVPVQQAAESSFLAVSQVNATIAPRGGSPAQALKLFRFAKFYGQAELDAFLDALAAADITLPDALDMMDKGGVTFAELKEQIGL